jgi:hypothetical protein
MDDEAWQLKSDPNNNNDDEEEAGGSVLDFLGFF